MILVSFPSLRCSNPLLSLTLTHPQSRLEARIAKQEAARDPEAVKAALEAKMAKAADKNTALLSKKVELSKKEEAKVSAAKAAKASMPESKEGEVKDGI